MEFLGSFLVKEEVIAQTFCGMRKESIESWIAHWHPLNSIYLCRVRRIWDFSLSLFSKRREMTLMYIDVFFCLVHLAQNSTTLVTPYIFSIGQARCSTKQLEIFEKIRPGQGMESPLRSPRQRRQDHHFCWGQDPDLKGDTCGRVLYIVLYSFIYIYSFI